MSNKTPAAKNAKTELAPKPPKRRIVRKGLLLGILCLFAAILLILAVRHKFDTSRGDMRFGSENMSLEYAITPADRERGLSGRDRLAHYRGMLFKFEQPGLHCFWMRDMKFPIDIVWLDEHKKVVDIRQNVEPSTYPASFCPAQNASYVVEVQAGLSAKAGVVVGEQIQF